jgi:hypothetical protein
LRACARLQRRCGRFRRTDTRQSLPNWFPLRDRVFSHGAALQVAGSSVVATYVDDTGPVFAQVAVVACCFGGGVPYYQVLTDQNGTTTSYFTVRSNYTCTADTSAAECAPFSIDGKTIDLSALPDATFNNVPV